MKRRDDGRASARNKLMRGDSLALVPLPTAHCPLRLQQRLPGATHEVGGHGSSRVSAPGPHHPEPRHASFLLFFAQEPGAQPSTSSSLISSRPGRVVHPGSLAPAPRPTPAAPAHRAGSPLRATHPANAHQTPSQNARGNATTTTPCLGAIQHRASKQAFSRLATARSGVRLPGFAFPISVR